MKVLVATDKPFAKVAVDGIRKEIEAAGYELVLLEKYGEKAKLLEAVKDANAIIIRSDIIDAEVLDAAKELKIVVRAGAGYDNVDFETATEMCIRDRVVSVLVPYLWLPILLLPPVLKQVNTFLDF